MSLAVGIGVVALFAAGWGAWERASAAKQRREADTALSLARAEAGAARLAESAARTAEAELARKLAAAGASVVEAEEGARRATTLAGELRRSLAQAQAERARLVEDAQLAEEARRALVEERDLLKNRLESTERSLAHVRDPERGASRAYVARMEELDRQNRELAARVDAWARRAQAAETELARREAGRGGDEVVRERDALRARVEALEDTLRQGARLRAGLRVLGLPEPARDTLVFSPERRAATDAALREAYLAAAATAAALVDARGDVWMRYGTPRAVERLAASAALLAEAPVGPALGAPPRLASEAFGAYGRHLAWLPGSPVVVALAASRETPALVLRLAALRLVGSVVPPATVRPPDAAPALEPRLSDRLDGWVTRRRAVAAAALGGAEPAGTDSAFVAACALLLPTVRALHARAVRDGFGEGFGVCWRAEDDTTLVARPLEDGRFVFARFTAPPAPRVVDDLAAAVRWAPAPAAPIGPAHAAAS